MQPVRQQIAFHDFAPEWNRFREEVLRGLQQPQKTLPCKYFYDEAGSELFDRICELSAYYPTRTEIAIMQAQAQQMAGRIGPDCLLIEYGSGSSVKTRILLDQLDRPAGYVPIDISREHLLKSAAAIAAEYPGLDVLPVCADYTSFFAIPEGGRPEARRVVYFPGSTIANLHHREAVQLLRSIAAICRPGGGLLIGVDLKKDPSLLHQAYNDPEGVTARFNLNILARINRELEADFDLERFRHYAFYNPAQGRIEMHLVSLCNQSVRLSGEEVSFYTGESIWTESSYKYDPDDFRSLATAAGFRVQAFHTDADRLFSVQFLTVAS